MNKSFFNFMVGGLRIKIMLTTVSHKPKLKSIKKKIVK